MGDTRGRSEHRFEIENVLPNVRVEESTTFQIRPAAALHQRRFLCCSISVCLRDDDSSLTKPSCHLTTTSQDCRYANPASALSGAYPELSTVGKMLIFLSVSFSFASSHLLTSLSTLQSLINESPLPI